MTRKDCLDSAAAAVLKDRQVTHGSPEDSFALVAGFWSQYIGTKIESHDVAIMLGLLKIARLKNNPHHDDSWIDLAGYAACGCEVVKPNIQATS